MKVLQINKFLFGGSGTETVMFRTASLLRAAGHEVSFFAMQDPRNEPCAESRFFPPGRYYSTEGGMLRQVRSAASSIYSLQTRRALRGLLRAQRPDIAHLHNVYHQLTLSVVDELVAQEIPIVMTVHDYKAVCPSYQAFTDHRPCHRCVTGHPGHVIAHRCIKGSLAASSLAAAEAVLSRTRKLYLGITAFITPSRHCAQLLVDGGLPAARMRLIPNFVQDDQFGDRPGAPAQREPMLLYVGRLEEAKGVHVLLAAAERMGDRARLVVVGDGPDRPAVEAARRRGVLEYYGKRDWAAIASLMDRASALLVPSIWEENCPMVVLEAGARGCPVIASDRGGLSELVDDGVDGLLTPAGDFESLADRATELVERPSLVSALGEARRRRTAERHSAATYLHSLLEVYSDTGPRPGGR